MPHPLDRPDLAAKIALYRAVCLGMVLVLATASVGFALVVNFALEGRPLFGRSLSVGSLSVPALAAAALTPVVVALAWVLARRQGRAAVARMRLEHPELDTPESNEERLLNAVAARLFYFDAVLIGTGFALAILYHVLAANVLLGCIAFLCLAVLAAFPTAARLKRWYDAAEADWQSGRPAPA